MNGRERVLEILSSYYPLFVMGKELRDELNKGVPWWKLWRRWTSPGFYLLMSRLEDQGEVTRQILCWDKRTGYYLHVFQWVPSSESD